MATATLASSLVDKIEYQVSYATGNAVAFTASVGKVSSIAILTATAEQNVTTDVKFALFDENGVDITSTVAVDADCDVAIEGVDGAIVTANTSKPSAATVQMTKVGDKAKVTVTYRPNESLAPATGEIVCTAAQATIGKARFKVATSSSGWKKWEDGTYCAKFYTGSDSTSVGVSLGAVNDGVFFCAEETDKPGTVISYDSYEVSSSNDDVMTANIEDNLDTGKYCRIAVSGNTVGTANILVKATKNGADYTYTIPVKVVAEKKLTGITVSASRPSMSNAIDEEYYGTLTVTGKYSDGTTSPISPLKYTSEVADADKNNKLSNNLLKAMNETQDEHTATTARGADAFTVNGAYYRAWGAQGKTYTINVATTNEDNKEVKAGTTVKVSDLSESAWKLDGDGAAMEYSVELTNGNALDVSNSSKTYTGARLAAYANKLFAGYVRQSSDGTVAIGTSAGSTEGEKGTNAEAYIMAPGETGSNYIKVTATETGDTVDAIEFNTTAVRGSDAVPGVAGEGYEWTATMTKLAKDAGFKAGRTQSYQVNDDGVYTAKIGASKESASEFILVVTPKIIAEPTEEQTGTEAEPGEAGEGFNWVATNTAAAKAAGFTKTTEVYTKSDAGVYEPKATTTEGGANDEFILVTNSEIVEDPSDEQLGTEPTKGDAGDGYMWISTKEAQATTAGFTDGVDTSYIKDEDGAYTLNKAKSTKDEKEFVLLAVEIRQPSPVELGTATNGAVTAVGNTWVDTKDGKHDPDLTAAGFKAGTTKTYTKVGNAKDGEPYYTADPGDFVLINYAMADPDDIQTGSGAITAKPGDGYRWVATDTDDAKRAGFLAQRTPSYKKANVLKKDTSVYVPNKDKSTISDKEFILIKDEKLATPDDVQLGTAAEKAEPGEGYAWVTTESEAAKKAGFVAGETVSYTVKDDVYTKNENPSKASDKEFVLVSELTIVTEPDETQLGSVAVVDTSDYDWDPLTKTLVINTYEDATTEELGAALAFTLGLENAPFEVTLETSLPIGVTLVPGAAYLVDGTPDKPAYLGAGQAKPTDKTTISGIYAAVKAGHLYSVDGKLFDSAINVATEKDYIKATTKCTTDIPVSTRAFSSNDTMLVGNTEYDYYFAKPGTYTPTFFFTMDGKDKTASTSVTVKNGFTAPVVTVNKRKLDSLTVDDIRDALTINCDMNNNTSSAESFTGDVYKSDKDFIIDESESDGDKWTATYIGVDDQGITFIVPINATFYAD